MSKTLNPEYYLIEDWKDYDQGLISSLGSRYFQVQGLKAYSIKTGNPIPSGITNSLPHAHSFIKVLKNNISNYPNNYKLNILDLGSGSGIFARYLLKTAQQEGILDKICVLLADLSATALQEIKAIKVLNDFKENENYKFIKINILEPDSAELLDGQRISLPKISACTLNYLFDVMPTIILRPSANNGFEKLQFRFLEKNIGQKFNPLVSDSELKSNLDYLKNLLIDERWIPYDIKEQNQIQQKYFYLLADENYQQQFAYSYGSLSLLESIYGMLDDYGFIFCAEMKNNPNPLRPFEIYGNSAAHYINEKLISKFANGLGAKRFYSQDHFLQKFIYFKNVKSMSINLLNKEFLENSATDVLMDLKQILMNLHSPHSVKLAKIILEELIKIDPDSAFSLNMQAKIANLSGDQKLFIEKLQAAKEVDFLGEY